ncbi:hypothetical protein [Slackia heliotrinireducens]|uniref:hypothetical protein n=1 Tax=Slackia heliotrinireducens TaxID=84110 RepID=UPI0033157F4A
MHNTKRKNAWLDYTPEELEKLEAFAQDYTRFISENKTERENAQPTEPASES